MGTDPDLFSAIYSAYFYFIILHLNILHKFFIL
jgi:hypothetical protein